MRRFSSLFLLAVVAMFGIGTVQAAEVVVLGPQTTGLELQEGSDEIIHVRVAEVRLDAVEIDGAEWAFVRAPSAQNTMERGLPSLPFLTSRYLLDRTGGISLELVSRKVRTIDLATHGFAGVVPSKGHFDRGIDPETVPWTFDAKVYASDVAFPTVDSRVYDPFISGPVRGQALQIPLVFWQADTNTLTVVEEAWFRVVQVADAANPRLGPERPRTTPFEAVIQTNTLNAEVFTSRSNPFVETGRLLIIADDDFMDEVQPFADWQTLVGYPTLLVPVSTAGSNATEIKSYIQSVYGTPEGLAWIILVGDSDEIPTLTGVNEGADCDACYTKLEGADNRPDAAISRISAQTGEQVTVQANKILDYEMYPSVGSAGAWYSEAFGVAGDDFGGGSPLKDWERMEMLRVDLIAPTYTYTEFDQLYHSPSAAAVGASVNDGKSLGLYIGHGSKTAWSTSGFSVSHINSDLTNADTLPVIWSVACVNGDFVGGSDCFGEAWLKKDGGGAVSFEGATTNESWIPPCVAQRGIVDSIRFETAFTTGGQHMAGKHAIMDEYGDGDGDEGTMWVEQSILFGGTTTWMRTLPAVAPDEPDDFSVVGTNATVTVKNGGSALAKTGAAIVSFYDDTAGINVVGSGFIDANGMVSAAVTGYPTHCHIHGQNLVPSSFALPVQRNGVLFLDAATYSCTSTVTVLVADGNIPGASPGTVDTVSVQLAAGGATHTMTLTEGAADGNTYSGTAALGTDLSVSHGDVLAATYVDADDGTGGVNTPQTAEASVDCLGPVITNVQAVADKSSITFSYTTSEPGTTVVFYGTSSPPTQPLSDDALVIDHQISLTGVDPCATYYFQVHSADTLGNLTASATTYDVETAGWGTFFTETFDSDPGWTIDNGSQSTGGWAFGQPMGLGQDIYGGPDPTVGATGDNVYGVNLQGDAPTSLTDNELKLTTPVMDLTDATSAQLRFQRWLGVESPSYDHARIRLSIDGGASWQTVWENDATVDDTSWAEQVLDLSAAVGQSQVQIRWTYGSTDSYWNYSGWNIDDVVVEGAMPCGAMDEIFGDDFESGDPSCWSRITD